jgi:hypothetical protein
MIKCIPPHQRSLSCPPKLSSPDTNSRLPSTCVDHTMTTHCGSVGYQSDRRSTAVFQLPLASVGFWLLTVAFGLQTSVYLCRLYYDYPLWICRPSPVAFHLRLLISNLIDVGLIGLRPLSFSQILFIFFLGAAYLLSFHHSTLPPPSRTYLSKPQ